VRLERDNEFWDIELDERSYVMRSGRFGTRGKSTRVTCPTIDEAMEAYDRQIVTMLKNGWLEPPRAEPPLAGLELRDAALEQAIRDQRDDRDAYLVYADWLQAAGNPIGELIALASAETPRKTPKVGKRIASLVASLRLPLPDQATFRFRWGLWRSLRVENMRDERGGPPTASPLSSSFMRALFSHVLCAALDELAIGALQWGHNYRLVPEVIDEAARHAWAQGLRTLAIGEIRVDPDPGYYESDYDAGKLGRPITKAFPNLTSLEIHAGFTPSDEASSLAGLELPRLTQLAIVAGWFGDGRYDQLTTMVVPALERLELWIGGSPAQRTADPTRVRGLFEAGRFAKLRHLALRNSRHADAFAAAIPSWPIAERLVTLDLSKGTLSDDGARSLLVNPRKLPALKHLVVDECYVSHDLVRALQARFETVSATGQRTAVAPHLREIAFLPTYATRRRGRR